MIKNKYETIKEWVKETLPRVVYVALVPTILLGGITGMIKLKMEGDDFREYTTDQVQILETCGMEQYMFTRNKDGDVLENIMEGKKTKMYDKNLDGKVDCMVIGDKTVNRSDETEYEFQRADRIWKEYFQEMELDKAIKNWEYLKKNGATLDDTNGALKDF